MFTTNMHVRLLCEVKKLKHIFFLLSEVLLGKKNLKITFCGELK